MSKKKGPENQAPSPPGIPTERVSTLSSQGLSEPEIIKTLREEGYSPLVVDRAMKDALRTGAGAQPAAPQAATMPPAPGAVQAPPPATPPRPAQPATPPPAPAGGAVPPPAPGGQGPYAAPPQPSQQGFPFGPSDKYAPTDWGPDEEEMEDMPPLPREKKLGPEPLLSGMDEDIPPRPPQQREMEPLPFAEPPLPKGKEGLRGLRDRRHREIEEVAEEITEEKWVDVMKRIKKLEDSFESVETSVKSGGDVSGTQVSAKEVEPLKKQIENQKHSIEETNARIDSLEEVVKGSLKPMIDSVKKFSGTAKGPSAIPSEPPAVQEPPAPEKEAKGK